MSTVSYGKSSRTPSCTKGMFLCFTYFRLWLVYFYLSAIQIGKKGHLQDDPRSDKRARKTDVKIVGLRRFSCFCVTLLSVDHLSQTSAENAID